MYTLPSNAGAPCAKSIAIKTWFQKPICIESTSENKLFVVAPNVILTLLEASKKQSTWASPGVADPFAILNTVLKVDVVGFTQKLNVTFVWLSSSEYTTPFPSKYDVAPSNSNELVSTKAGAGGQSSDGSTMLVLLIKPSFLSKFMLVGIYDINIINTSAGVASYVILSKVLFTAPASKLIVSPGFKTAETPLPAVIVTSPDAATLANDAE